MFEWYLDGRYHEQNDYIDQAFWIYYADTGDYKQEMAAFAQRWGNFDLATYKQVLTAGQGDDRCVALYLIAFSQPSQAHDLLLPFLNSSSVKERVSSALLLGELGEEQAVPILCTLLTEFLPTQNMKRPGGDRETQYWYELHRFLIVWVLHAWMQPNVTATLRSAFEQTIAAEPYALLNTELTQGVEDGLAYELGYRGVFGMLSGMQLNPVRLRLAVTNMVVGFYDFTTHPNIHGKGRRTFESVVLDVNNQIKPSFRDLIMLKFGWSEQEADACVESYFDDWNARTVENQD
jgi:hypothetical protein